MSLFLFFVFFTVSVFTFSVTPCYADDFYVSPKGSDSGDGSKTNPWATISKAIQTVPDNGSTVIVRDGLYTGSYSWSRAFRKKLTVQAEHPYLAQFTGRKGTNRILYLENLSNVEFNGLEFHGNGSSEGDYLIQLGKEDVHHLVFRNCIFHDSYKNDLLKVNNLTHDILFSGCVFYNPNNHGGDEHFDINFVTDITIEDSILFNDYAGSHRPEENQSHSFVVIKNSTDKFENVTRNITFRRNVFLGWSGLADQAFILTGEDGRPFFEASKILIENNLFIHHTPPRIVSTFLFKGGIRDVTVRANTITGEPNGGGPGCFSAYSAVFLNIGKNPPQENVIFANNVFSSNAGKMQRFSAGKKEFFVPDGLKVNNNVYWNGGKSFPAEKDDVFVPANDTKAILKSPKLPDVPKKIVFPRRDDKNGAFLSGNKTIRQEFERLVNDFAVPQSGSSVIDAADPARMPKTDILGKPRNDKPDCGCLEL